MQAILALPHIPGSQPSKIHDFYEKLLSNVQALETLGKLREISGYVRMTIDKLEGIREPTMIGRNGNFLNWSWPSESGQQETPRSRTTEPWKSLL